MSVTIPKQSVPPCDNLPDASGAPAVFSKPWWIALQGVVDAVNNASVSTVSAADNLVTINGVQVTY